MLLTSRQLLAMVRHLTDDAGAAALEASGLFAFIPDDALRFPPAQSELYQERDLSDLSIMMLFKKVAGHVADHVLANFGELTGCATPATDACATAYLLSFAEKAYRRPVDDDERTEVSTRYTTAREGGATAEEAVREVVAGVLIARPFLLRFEEGDPSRPSVSPPGLPLTPYELASAVSFFLTDGPPDEALLAAARAGTLAPDSLSPHVDRLLSTPAARAWLTLLMEVYFRLNQLPGTWIDPGSFPEVDAPLVADMQTEGRRFLDFTLWNRPLTDLLTSRTTFLNASLASKIYRIPLPPGASETDFVEVTLPDGERSGILTNAGFLTGISSSLAFDLPFWRGFFINDLFVGQPVLGHPDRIPEVEDQLEAFATETDQEQAAFRAMRPACNECHRHLDPYGLALGRYDRFGRIRAVDHLGKPVYSLATLPPEVGGGPVADALELARRLAQNDILPGQLANALLAHATTLRWIEERIGSSASCAVSDIVARWKTGGALTFPALVRRDPVARLQLAAPNPVAAASCV